MEACGSPELRGIIPTRFSRFLIGSHWPQKACNFGAASYLKALNEERSRLAAKDPKID